MKRFWKWLTRKQVHIVPELECMRCTEGILALWMSPQMTRATTGVKCFTYRCDRCGTAIAPGMVPKSPQAREEILEKVQIRKVLRIPDNHKFPEVKTPLFIMEQPK
jgi:DNA-directed RNA polymerase subunit RPC12/RpoP